jgi:hypothetical protein
LYQSSYYSLFPLPKISQIQHGIQSQFRSAFEMSYHYTILNYNTVIVILFLFRPRFIFQFGCPSLSKKAIIFVRVISVCYVKLWVNSFYFFKKIQRGIEPGSNPFGVNIVVMVQDWRLKIYLFFGGVKDLSKSLT